MHAFASRFIIFPIHACVRSRGSAGGGRIVWRWDGRRSPLQYRTGGLDSVAREGRALTVEGVWGVRHAEWHCVAFSEGSSSFHPFCLGLRGQGEQCD